MTVAQKCPVCEGKGKVPPGFYPDGNQSKWQECHACGGRGIVYGYAVDPVPYVPAPVPMPRPIPYPYVPVRPWQPPYWAYTSGTTVKPPVDVTYQITATASGMES